MKKIYAVKNLDCANCGGKIEAAINALDEVEKAVLNFPARKLNVTGNISSLTEKAMQDICDRIENGVIIEPYENNHNHEHEHEKGSIISLVSGVILFVSALIFSGFNNMNLVSDILYIFSYIILGYKIIISALKNIFKGNFFDENFLMTIATIGAICLGDFPEAVGVVLFFNIGSLFEHYAVEKSRREISSAVNLKVEEADVLENGSFVTKNTDEIKSGDIIRIKTGDRIPVDAVVKSGESFLDTSAINGEPVPIRVKTGDKVLSGYINTKSVIEIQAEATAENSMLAKIAETIENASDSKPRIDRFITRFSKIYTPLVILSAIAVAVIPSLITGNWNYWIYTALTFLVISCPCALVLSVPLAYFSGIGKASKHGILFKGGDSLEVLSTVKAIAFDKTGTVTEGSFNVTEIKTCGDFSEKQLLQICGGCESVSSHPVAVSIVNYCREKNIEFVTPKDVEEIAGMGLKSGNILCGNEKLMNKYGVSLDIKPESFGSEVYIACDKKLCGYIIVSDSIKENSSGAVSDLKSMGIKTFMLTGDKSKNADMVAEKTGIEKVYSELLPDQKLEKIKEIRGNCGITMFIGDGINDAPVLAGADIGAAMQSGSDLALESSDVIFMKSDLMSAVNAKKIADKTARITKQNIIFAIGIKLAVLVLGLLGIANMWFAVFADSGTAMLLAVNSIRILYQKKS